MRVTATPELVDYLEAHGGVLYVGTHRSRCCASVAWLRTSSVASGHEREFELSVRDRVVVCTRTPIGRLPDELSLSLEGRRRKKPVASWNGCAYVV